MTGKSPDPLPDMETFVKSHGKKLYNLAYRVCGDPIQAEDILQESLIKIHEKCHYFIMFMLTEEQRFTPRRISLRPSPCLTTEDRKLYKVL